MSAAFEIPSDFGPRPQMAWVKIELLATDARYQRDVSDHRGRSNVRRIVENFSWRRFQPPTVAPIDGGRYAVLDGQHRVEAARQIPAIDAVPCYIVDAPELRAQADTFVAVNRDRVSVNKFHLHHAQVLAGDPDAVHLQHVLDQVGVVIPRYPMPADRLPPRHTLAMGVILKLLKAHGDGPVVRALRVLVEAYPNTGGELRGQLIDAVVRLFVMHKDVDEKRLVEVIAERTGTEIVEAAQAYKRNFGGDTTTAIRTALERNYNAGRRTNKLGSAT